MDNICFLDLETSGLSQNTNAICQIAGKIYKRNLSDVVATIDYYIKPYDKIYTEKAYEVNGLSKEFLEEFGEHISIVIDEFVKFIFDNNVSVIVGHNVNFDLRFLVYELSKRNFLKCISFKKIAIIDTRYLNYPKNIKGASLETLCKYYNIKYVGKHNAMHDVESTFELFKISKY